MSNNLPLDNSGTPEKGSQKPTEEIEQTPVDNSINLVWKVVAKSPFPDGCPSCKPTAEQLKTL